jgi:hypothetical protein
MQRGANDLENDKIRILTTIIRQMTSGFVMAGFPKPQHGAWIESTGWKGEHLKVGDLVVCNTSGLHDWTIGFVHEIKNDPQWGLTLVLREIGSNRLCNVGNESFFVIKGLSENELWEGQKYKFAKQISKVFCQYGDGDRLFSRIEFIDDEFANVYIRAYFGGTQGSGAERMRMEIGRNFIAK